MPMKTYAPLVNVIQSVGNSIAKAGLYQKLQPVSANFTPSKAMREILDDCIQCSTTNKSAWEASQTQSIFPLAIGRAICNILIQGIRFSETQRNKVH